MSRLTEFATLAVRSGLVTIEEIKRAYQSLDPTTQGSDEQAPRLFAQHLIRQGMLTPYQAGKLLTGATHGFFLGIHKILKPLAKGGSSRVYLASRPGGQLVALKVLSPGPDDDIAPAVARFHRELEVSRRLCHPRIAQAIELCEQDEIRYLVMEYVEGMDAESMVIRKTGLRPWLPRTAAKYLVQVLDGLAALHASGVIHRDIKPSNLMVKPNADAAILDLGSARIIGEYSAPSPTSNSVEPSEGVIGTLDFISPEQIDNPNAADARSDLYSVGCTLHFLLTGQAPFAGGGAINKIFKHRLEPPPPIPDLSPGFAAILQRLMAKEPSDRHASCGELQTDLNLWLRRERRTRSDVSL